MAHLANLRDVGGLPAGDGRRTRFGVLLRSDAPQPGDAVPRDVAWPPALVLDLRSQDELGEEHPLAAAGVDVRAHPLAAGAGIERIAETHPDLASLYAGMVTGSAERIVAAVRDLADAPEQGPTLVHCAAGKDRTGVLVAVVLAAVGVDRRAILADYERTGPNMPGVLERFRRDPAATDVIASLVARRPEYFEVRVEAVRGVLDGLDAEHGGARAWLLAHGLAPDALGRLERRLLAGRPG